MTSSAQQDEKHQHPDQENPGRGKFERIDIVIVALRHGHRLWSHRIWHRQG